MSLNEFYEITMKLKLKILENLKGGDRNLEGKIYIVK